MHRHNSRACSRHSDGQLGLTTQPLHYVAVGVGHPKDKISRPGTITPSALHLPPQLFAAGAVIPVLRFRFSSYSVFSFFHTHSSPCLPNTQQWLSTRSTTMRSASSPPRPGSRSKRPIARWLSSTTQVYPNLFKNDTKRTLLAVASRPVHRPQ